MDDSQQNLHLSELKTLWSVVHQAHEGPLAEQQAARQALWQRYGGAAYRYLLGSLRDRDAAEELFQEFALRFVRGDFHRAAHERGRFRQFLKTALFHLIIDYHRSKRGQLRPMPEDVTEPAAVDDSPPASDSVFLDSWRDELLAGAWARLKDLEEKSGTAFYTVLRYRADHVDESSEQMAHSLNMQMEKQLTPAGVRQLVHRAREKFADFLLDQVVQSLQSTDTDELEQELIDLGLLEYCRPALQRRANA